MDIHDVRRQRLRHLAIRYSSPAALARMIGMDPSQLSKLISTHPSKQLGQKLARRIESILQLPPGWLDSLDETTLRLSDKFAALPQAQQTLIGKLLDHPIDDEAATALTILINRL